MGVKLNRQGSRLILRMLKGDVSLYEVRRALLQKSKPFTPGPCVPGPNRMCVKHGQSLSDCQKDDD